MQDANSPRTWARRLAGPLLALALSQLAAGAALAGPMLLYEVGSDRVLYADEPDRPWHPASLTKLMTAYIAFEELRAGRLTLDTALVQSANAHKEPPSKIGLPVGATMSLDLGLRALIIKSANDVAVMIGERISGSEGAFVQRMNQTASRLGMLRTRFRNPNGLPDPAQVTTARDMALLTRAIIHDFPERADLFAQSRMRIGDIPLRSHNALLERFEGADGMKTGFICASGFNIVASASRNGRRLVAVVLGALTAPERTERTGKLLEYGFRAAGWRGVLGANSLDALPRDPARAVAPRNVRGEVRVGTCGYRAPATAAATKPKAKARAASATGNENAPARRRSGASGSANRR
ncbi:MAG: D-alanyl-D-alanine carboxypeptidase [Rhizobiales bacterium]|nr:D-alanyl-D-alanine carboxypeptidase [Hyphomicrobiales bacterium]